MAYFTQQMKKERAEAIKAISKKYNVKISLCVKNYTTFEANITQGKLDFISECKREVIDGYIQVNEFNIDSNFSGKSKEMLLELKAAMMVGNHDNSDSMTDYFDVGFYINIKIGRWDKPYKLI